MKLVLRNFVDTSYEKIYEKLISSHENCFFYKVLRLRELSFVLKRGSSHDIHRTQASIIISFSLESETN